MNAKYVVSKFGGQSTLAELIGKGQSTVAYWVKANTIPAKWQAKLLEIAKVQGIALTSADFVGPTTEKNVIPTEPEDQVTVESNQGLPIARYRGALNIIGISVPCYVLDNGQKIIGRTSATEVLTGIKGGGDLEKYIAVKALEPFINKDLILERLVPFRLLEVEGLDKAVKGLPHDLMIELCQGFVAALQASLRPDSPYPKLTERQQQMAMQASIFLSACAKVGLEALIDEATGYQYERAEDALQVKLRAFIADELRAWEKTFPDELWAEFGRLTGWQGTLHARPKWWGKLVIELIYDTLDPDVAKYLKENRPPPGIKWFQQLTDNYGARQLVSRCYEVIGMSKECTNMRELRDKVAKHYGKRQVQFVMYLPPAKDGAEPVGAA